MCESESEISALQGHHHKQEHGSESKIAEVARVKGVVDIESHKRQAPYRTASREVGGDGRYSVIGHETLLW